MARNNQDLTASDMSQYTILSCHLSSGTNASDSRPPSPVFSDCSVEASRFSVVATLELLLCNVVHGQQVEVDKLLSQDPTLLLGRGDVTDYSGRLFKQISACEYAWWALDFNMLMILVKHIKDLNPSEIEGTKHEINWRIAYIESYGLPYMQNGEKKCSKSFDLSYLVDAYSKYIRQVGMNQQAWMDVGLAQRDLPAHIVNEYCKEIPLCDSVFHKLKVPENCTFTVSGNESENWFQLTRPDEYYTFLRGDSAKPVAVTCLQAEAMYGSCIIDFQALLSLQKARNNQLENWRKTFLLSRTPDRFESLLDLRFGGELTKFLDFKEVASFGLAQSKSERQSRRSLRVSQFLGLVVGSKLGEANELLMNYPEILLESGYVADYSGRLFHNISAFEHVVWSGNSRMFSMLLSHIKTEEQKATIFRRLLKMEENGLDYEQSGRDYKNSKQFDFSPLIFQLQYMSNNANYWVSFKCLNEMVEAWTDLGLKQSQLPAHVIQEFRNLEYSNKADHNKPSIPFFNYFLLRKVNEWPPTEDLGHAFAFSISNFPTCVSVTDPESGIKCANKDLRGMQRLIELRKLECQLFISTLKSPTDSISRFLLSKSVLSQVNPSTQSDTVLLAKFLSHVVQGEQSMAETLLKKYPKLLLMRGDVTDYSGRSFKQISACQYAIWAKDINMLIMLLTHIKVKEEKALTLQFVLEMKENGLTYEQGGVIKCSKHFDVYELIKAFKFFDRELESIGQIDAVTPMDDNGNFLEPVFFKLDEHGNSRQLATEAMIAEQRKLWTSYFEIGIKQRDLPVCWVNQYYCHPDRDLNPITDFNEQKLDGHLPFQEPSGLTRSWFPLGKLGREYSLFRGRHNNKLSSVLVSRPDDSRQAAFDDMLGLWHLLLHLDGKLEKLLMGLLSPALEQSNKPGF